MKKICFLVITILLFQISKAQDDKAAAEQAIVRFFDGLATLNEKMIRENCTNDFILLEDGEVWNMDTLISKISPKKSTDFKRTNHFNFFQTEISGNQAWMAYDNTANITINGRDIRVDWLESAILRKEKGVWKIWMLHSTVKEKDK